MKKRTDIFLVMITALFLALVIHPADLSAEEFDYRGQHWLSLNTVPTDSAQSEQRRVWLPLERSNDCMCTVTIHDQSGNKVRTLYEALIGGGYHNLYWDKRDDSGQWVPAGDYTYKIDDCKVKKESKVTASYQDGETDLLVFAPQTEGNLAVEFDLVKDSLPVTISILNTRGRVIDTVFSDSVMAKGRHHFDWLPNKIIAKGYFRIQVSTSGAEHYVFVHYMKK